MRSRWVQWCNGLCNPDAETWRQNKRKGKGTRDSRLDEKFPKRRPTQRRRHLKDKYRTRVELSSQPWKKGRLNVFKEHTKSMANEQPKSITLIEECASVDNWKSTTGINPSVESRLHWRKNEIPNTKHPKQILSQRGVGSLLYERLYRRTRR